MPLAAPTTRVDAVAAAQEAGSTVETMVAAIMRIGQEVGATLVPR